MTRHVRQLAILVVLVSLVSGGCNFLRFLRGSSPPPRIPEVDKYAISLAGIHRTSSPEEVRAILGDPPFVFERYDEGHLRSTEWWYPIRHLAAVPALGPTGLDRLVTVLRLSPEISAHPQATKRLMDEARLAARLSNPGLVRVLGIGRVEQSFYLSTELVEGRSLATISAPRRQKPTTIGSPGSVERKKIADTSAFGNSARIVSRTVSRSNSYTGFLRLTVRRSRTVWRVF